MLVSRLCRLLLVLLMMEMVYAGEYDDMDEDSDEGLYKYAELTQFPFMVFLTSKAGHCSGVILNEHWVMTAANCLFDNREKPLKDQAVIVKAGIVDYHMEQSNNQQVRPSIKVVIHRSFVLNRVGKYNVGLIKVRDPFEFGEFVGKISVSAGGWPQTRDKIQNCTAYGYGSYYTTSVESTVLKYWNVSVEHGERACPCLRRFQWKRLICVKEKKFPRLCKSDSGGPLVCNGTVAAVGHMVWDRHSCASPIYPQENCRGDLNNDPKLTNGISSFYFLCPLNDWIREYVPEVPQTPASCRAPSIHHQILTLLSALFITFI